MDFFATIPSDVKRQQLAQYTDYLAARDGEINLATRSLAKREKTIAAQESVSQLSDSIDEAKFRRAYTNFSSEKSLSEEELLLLSLVKVNAAEAYGVEQNFQRTMSRAQKNGDEAELRILCEEGYHTRILLSSAKLYGIELTEPYRPPSALRIMIGGIATMPMSIARPLTLTGEIIATLMFRNLIGIARRVLKDKPELRDQIEERLTEICTDECGHISYNRLHSNAMDLANTRIMLSTTAKVMAKVFPEIVALGAYPKNVVQELPKIADPRNLPEQVRKEAFLA